MKLEEIQAGIAADQRLKRMKASAKAAKDRARQLKAQVDATADRLDLQRARQNLLRLQRSVVTGNIKPYH